MNMKSSAKIRLGISSCLLGEKVRFDGGHKHDRYITDTLGQYFEWVPVCPEVELGLGAPRETMRLEQSADDLRLIMPKAGRDLTAPMQAYARKRAATLAPEDLSGYIFKSGSPSCGLYRVRVYGAGGMASRTGRGLFAAAIVERFPHLPIEEEGRLADPHLRENWIERVFAYRRIKDLWNSRWSITDLISFHAAHKLILLAHSPKALPELGRLLAQAKGMPRTELRRAYHEGFMSVLAIMATRGRHANVLQHMAGYFKKLLDEDSRRELSGMIEEYRKGEVPLIVPMTMVKHYVRRFGNAYLRDQLYLNPHPKELALRNQI